MELHGVGVGRGIAVGPIIGGVAAGLLSHSLLP